MLTTEYPPFFGGGIGTYCSQTATIMASKGNQVSVFINDNHVSGIKIEATDNIRLIRFNPSFTKSGHFLGYVTNISLEFANIVKQFVEKEGAPDIIESQEYLGIAYYLMQYKYLNYSWCKNIPILITMHSPSFLYMEYNHVPMYRYPNYWICEMEKFCLQAADHIISPSQFMVDELAKRFDLTNQNLSIVPNPFSFTIEINETDHPNNADQIVFYGKLTAQKGAFELLKYFKDLWDDGFKEPLYLLGGQDIVYHPEDISMGDLIRKKYHQYIENGLLKLEDKIPPSKRSQRLAKAKIVVVPSNNDNLPYVVFEMMALNKLLLVSKQGGHREVIRNGVEGFVFDHEEPESFRSQLEHALSLSVREKKNIVENAFERVKNGYNGDVIYEMKLSIISKILRKGLAPRTNYPFIRSQIDSDFAITNNSSKRGKLTVVVPYFNMGHFLDETIQSILLSEYPDKDIIIINDGSTDDNSLKKLDKYRNHDKIRVVDIANSGLAKARNYGAKLSSSEYLAFLDADDTVEKTYYSKAIAAISSYDNVHFSGCWTQYFGDSDKIWPAFTPEPPVLLYHNMINSSSLVYKLNSFLHAGMNDSEMLFQGWEDYESVVSMVASGLNGVVIPEPLFNYRIRAKSMVRGLSKEKKLVLFQHISEKHKRIYAKFAPDLFNLLNANGPGLNMDNPSLDHHLADKIPFGGNFSLKLIKLIKRNRYVKPLAYKIYRLLNK